MLALMEAEKKTSSPAQLVLSDVINLNFWVIYAS